ncbi:MAG: type III-B CRISPR-associated protein Cas10/Cmr2 [Betaproteobacteria bacterium]|nr:type III-B CRISPR-associated protein Cas10/Cmr2 [Betaproteobacteria bacterium]
MTDWKLKLAAWLHDPAEKALILMRTPEGHEFGTARMLREKLGIDYGAFDKRADWLAAAADRPQWPRPEDERYAAWANVRFAQRPELIHPLSGETIDLKPLTADIGAAEIKAVSVDHFEKLIVQDDPRLTLLAFWRFGPEAGRWASDLGALWQMLPADTRVPDHSIWAHLDTVSALHTALAGGDKPALLAMSFGPVQGFIAQARSTSDLWAGSHLLSSIVWEAMKTVVADIGPDAVLFPALRGVPAVDRWLIEEGGEELRAVFEKIGAEFLSDKTDTNPLFAAALPNKFVAVVPARRARELGEKACAAARRRALAIALDGAERVFKEADAEMTDTTRAQIGAQMAEFPEAFWASATWPMTGDVKDIAVAASQLGAALSAIHPDLARQGVFHENTWPVLTKELKLDGWQFWQPNAGVLYPAVYELADRSLAAAKAARPFDRLVQEGHRCTQCGEREWLTDNREHLGKNREERKAASVWGRLAGKRRAWAKEGEHLCAVCTAKRLWPTLFAAEVGEVVGARIDRFVVSTHALALSTSIDRLLDKYDAGVLERLNKLSRDFDLAQDAPATLPKSLHAKILRVTRDDNAVFVLKRLPSALDRLRDADDKSPMDRALKGLFGEDNKPETYYALIQMDGDRMGAWLAGNEDQYKQRYRDTWHSQVRAEVDKFAEHDPALKKYLNTFRPSSPARHAAISRALNDFSIHLARHIVEDCVKGKLLYAGGDDVLALVAVDDLFDAMLLLRLAYSGIAPHESMGLGERLGELRPGSGVKQRGMLLKEGFGLLNGRLMTLMGQKATASMGAVVAHHTAPLAMVLRQLREAENRAKHHRRQDASGKEIDRDAFCIRILKRGGGEVSVTSPWWPVAAEKQPVVGRSALALMKNLRDELAFTDFSRGAIYRAQLWFEGLTDDAKDIQDNRWRAQMAGSLAWQFDRQKGTPEVARDVVDFVCDVMKPETPKTALENFLATAEFFARESRIERRDTQ